MANPRGELVVGIHENGREVVINHPEIMQDDTGGHIILSPDQARHLARVLSMKAAEIDSPKRKPPKRADGTS